MTLPNEHKPDAKSGKRPKGDYVVGKCKPPIHTQWPPGQSGNPSGRPKGRRNLKTELKELLRKTDYDPRRRNRTQAFPARSKHFCPWG